MSTETNFFGLQTTNTVFNKRVFQKAKRSWKRITVFHVPPTTQHSTKNKGVNSEQCEQLLMNKQAIQVHASGTTIITYLLIH